MKYQYQARNEQEWNKRANQSGAQYAGYAKDEFRTFSPKNTNNIRILPPSWPNPHHYGFDLWVHFGVGPDNGTVICLHKMKNQKCPVCAAQATAEDKGRDDEAKALKPTRRVLVWLVDRKEEAEKKEATNPVLWAMPWTVDRDISKICKDRESGALFMIDHPEAGFDVFFDKEGEGINTKYTGFQLSRRPSPVADRYLDYIQKNPIPSTLLWRDYDEVMALFIGEAPMDAPPPPPATEVAPPQFETKLTSAPPPPPPPVVAVAPPPPPPPPPKPFVSEWVEGSKCAACGKKQYTTPTGLACESGHTQDNLPFPSGNGEGDKPKPEAKAEPKASTASALRARFQAGQGK